MKCSQLWLGGKYGTGDGQILLQWNFAYSIPYIWSSSVYTIILPVDFAESAIWLLLYSPSRTKPPKVDKDEDPGVGLMKLMKQMYDEGDDEMKRTIAKAWHESQEKRAKGTEDLPL